MPFVDEHQDFNQLIERQGQLVYKLAYARCGNQADAEDIFQQVFLRYLTKKPVFVDAEHEKAWFIRVTINACKDLLKNFFHSHTVPLDLIMEQPIEIPPDYQDILEAVFSLPQKYRDVVYLHYFEDYTAPEISQILGKNVNTIYTLLTRSKRILREKLGGDKYEL